MENETLPPTPPAYSRLPSLLLIGVVREFRQHPNPNNTCLHPIRRPDNTLALEADYRNRQRLPARLRYNRPQGGVVGANTNRRLWN